MGVSVELPDGARARLEHGLLVVSQGARAPVIPERELSVPGAVEFPGAGLRVTAELLQREELPERLDAVGDEVAYFDPDAVRPPLRVRGRRQGDRFRPFGLDGSKTVKELMIDEKVAASFRDAVPLVCDREGILWVVGVRRSATAPVTEETRTVLAIRARAEEESPGAREGPAH